MYNAVVSKIRELYSVDKGFIPLHVPIFMGNEKKYLNDAIDSTFVSSIGAYVNKFEDMMAKITGAKYAVAVVNGTAALHIALKLAGVKQNDEVFSQALTFVATANAISYEKAIPHFVDVDEDTLGMSPNALKKRLKEVAEIRKGVCYNRTTGNKIAACVPMHTFGFPAKIDEIIDVCNKYHIPVLEDAAESLGSYFRGKHTGTFGLMGIYSFNGNKTVTCGGGGAIVTDDKQLAKHAKHLTTTAKVPHKWEYAHDQIGYNYRMPNLNAAMACAQLELLEQFIENKRETAKQYEMFLRDVDTVQYIKEPPHCKANYWLNALRFSNEQEKENFLEYSNAQGVMTRPVWRLMNRLGMFKNCPTGDLPIANALGKTIVNIPSSVRL